MAKVERKPFLPPRMIIVIMRRGMGLGLAMNKPMKRCPISGKEMTNHGN
jgi:hypothetical protein